MENILIRNEKGIYSKWLVTDYDEERNCFHIALNDDKSIISTISKNKIVQKENGKYYSDVEKSIKEKYNFAFTSFGSIKI